MGQPVAIDLQLIVDDGVIRNPTFTDYLLPTFLDAPSVDMRFIEEPDHWGPFGAKGIGEAPIIPVAAAIANAVYDATGVRVTSTPINPTQLAELFSEHTAKNAKETADAS